MIIIIGKFLSIVAKKFPNLAYHWRGRILATIMSKHTFGIMEKIDVWNRANKFLETMSEEESGQLINDMGLPIWSGSKFKGVMGDE
jgi:hypothetical protein